MKKYPELQHQTQLQSSVFHYSHDTYCVDVCWDIEKMRQKMNDDDHYDFFLDEVSSVAYMSNECVEIRMDHPEDIFVDLGKVRREWDLAGTKKAQEMHDDQINRANRAKHEDSCLSCNKRGRTDVSGDDDLLTTPIRDTFIDEDF